MNAVATAWDWWNAGPGKVKAGCGNSRLTGTEKPAVTTRGPWQTFTLNVSENGWTRPKLQARKPRGHVNFRTSLPGRPRPYDRSAVV